MLLQIKEQAEIVIVISTEDIVNSKLRADLGITYDVDVIRLIDAFTERGLLWEALCLQNMLLIQG